MDKTLREVCTAEKVSRRAVQGYEKAGLVLATGRNNRGHLLYNEAAQRRIAEIRMYQEFGFSIVEISEIIDAPKHVLKKALEERLVKLKEERKRVDCVIRRASELIEQL